MTLRGFVWTMVVVSVIVAVTVNVLYFISVDSAENPCVKKNCGRVPTTCVVLEYGVRVSLCDEHKNEYIRALYEQALKGVEK